MQSPAFPGGSTSAACFSGCCSPPQSFVEPNTVLIVILILIVIDAKGAQALRAAGQPVVAGLVLRSGARQAPRDRRAIVISKDISRLHRGDAADAEEGGRIAANAARGRRHAIAGRL